MLMDKDLFDKLRAQEQVIQETANWYSEQVNKLNREISQINKMPPESVDFEKVEELDKRKTYFDNKAIYELKELEKFKIYKEKTLINNLRLAITGQNYAS
jgi:hypothetical protein